MGLYQINTSTFTTFLLNWINNHLYPTSSATQIKDKTKASTYILIKPGKVHRIINKDEEKKVSKNS